jgi:hypothetical protein
MDFANGPYEGPYGIAEIRTTSFEEYQATLESWGHLGREVVHVDRLDDGWRVFYALRFRVRRPCLPTAA